jgi:hypothetical protein
MIKQIQHKIIIVADLFSIGILLLVFSRENIPYQETAPVLRETG